AGHFVHIPACSSVAVNALPHAEHEKRIAIDRRTSPEEDTAMHLYTLYFARWPGGNRFHGMAESDDPPWGLDDRQPSKPPPWPARMPRCGIGECSRGVRETPGRPRHPSASGSTMFRVSRRREGTDDADPLAGSSGDGLSPRIGTSRTTAGGVSRPAGPALP